MGAHTAIEKAMVYYWCDRFKRTSVFTLNSWMKCPWRGVQFGMLGPFPKVLRVATYIDSPDMGYDCQGVRSNGQTKLVPSYGSYILTVLQDIFKFRQENCGTRISLANTEDRNGITNTGICFRMDVKGIKSNTVNASQGVRAIAEAIGKNVADISACHLQVSAPTMERVDMLASTLASSRSLVYYPSNLPLEEDVFVETFSTPLWGCFFAAFVLLIICFRFSTWLHSKVRPDHEPWSWVEVVLWGIAAVCQQSYSRYPKGLSCRTTFIIGYLITYLLYTGFAAGVTSLLAVQSQNLQIDLDEVGDMKLNLVTAHTTHNPFIKGPETGSTRYYEKAKRIKTTVVRDNKALFRKLKQPNTVGYAYTTSLEHYFKEHKDLRKSIQITPLQDLRFQESLVVRKGFKFKKRINSWLLRMAEHGLIDYGKRKFINDLKETCCKESAWSQASIYNVYSAIAILIAGYFISVMILFAEMAWMRRGTGSQWETKAKTDVVQQIKNSKKRNLFSRTAMRINDLSKEKSINQ